MSPSGKKHRLGDSIADFWASSHSSDAGLFSFSVRWFSFDQQNTCVGPARVLTAQQLGAFISDFSHFSGLGSASRGTGITLTFLGGAWENFASGCFNCFHVVMPLPSSLKFKCVFSPSYMSPLNVSFLLRINSRIFQLCLETVQRVRASDA